MDNCSIILNIKQTADGFTDESELFTKGEFRLHKGSFFIDYDESEATGYEGSHVQMRIDDKMMTLTRTGTTFSSLIFENKTRHFCHYGTEFGDCMVGITTDELKPELNENGGKVHLKYTIDVNGGLMAENEITINVKM
ncbi:MAG: DUF1934 domain-containing protein [Oscillospiraceae bacterium]|nr:DUF1934 domain-containing protein [Oscillospiraceae bacterium]